jgi:hypothetical protein
LGIRRDAVALAQHQDVAAHHLTAGDAEFLAVADDEGTRRRQIAQGLQGPLGLALLGQGDADDHEDESKQEQGLRQVAQYQVDTPGDQQHEEHGLGHHLAHDGEEGLGGTAGQQVGTLRRQAALGFGLAEAGKTGGRGDSGGGYPSVEG